MNEKCNDCSQHYIPSIFFCDKLLSYKLKDALSNLHYSGSINGKGIMYSGGTGFSNVNL